MSDPQDELETVELELTEPVVRQVEAAAALVGDPPERFMENAILGRLQAMDNIIHDDAVTDIPAGFDAEAWRRRYQHIRRLQTHGE